MQKLLQNLEKLKLPNDKYAIYGSGSLAVRGIRATDDIDVIVTEDLYEELKERFGEKGEGKISINDDEIEIFPTWNALIDEPEEVVDRAETIQGFKFVTLEDTMKWKRKMGRDKDKKDIELIKEYEKRG